MTATLNTSVTPSTDFSKLRLSDIVQSLPKACFVQNPIKAWTGVITNVLAVVLGYCAIAYSPWFLLPFTWFFTGTALTGFFVIGHDSGHRSFAQKTWVNDLVGHIFMLPLIYPFHSWRILHNFHHLHTNKLDVDNAWRPFTEEFYESLPTSVRAGYRAIRGYFWWVGSIAHWFTIHFDWRTFEGKERAQVRFSSLLVMGTAAIVFPILIWQTGLWGFIKFWFVPWMVYHFWMSTFTLVHHTILDVPFRPADQWNAAEAQLAGTIHCDYPRWVEWLCHDINVHVPHHVSTAIPSYNLRMAHKALKEQWGDVVRECRFSWSLMRDIADKCHLYEPGQNYQSFQEYRERK